MEFYKMFQIVHFRTDWIRLYRWQRKIMMPEWYEEREKQTRDSLERLLMPLHIMKTYLPRNYYNN